MKSVNYQDLRKDEVVDGLEVGDIIQNPPTDIRFAAALDRGWVECVANVLSITVLDGFERKSILIGAPEFGALKEAIEWAKR